MTAKSNVEEGCVLKTQEGYYYRNDGVIDWVDDIFRHLEGKHSW